MSVSPVESVMSQRTPPSLDGSVSVAIAWASMKPALKTMSSVARLSAVTVTGAMALARSLLATTT